MAIERELTISLDASGAIKTVKDLVKDIDSLNEETDKVKEKTDKASGSLDKMAKSGKKGSTGIVNLTGSLVKSLGIVALISKAFELFSGALMKNQKVADTVNTVMGTIEIVLSEVVGVIVDVVTKVGEATGGFDALGKVVTGLITIAFTPLKAAFFGIKLAILELQLAWEESFFGDEDPETIKDLNKRISETKDNLIEVGEDALEAGKKVVDNFIPALQSIGQVVEGTIDGISKIDVKAAAAQAKALTQLENNAIEAEAQAARLAAQYENQAEIQRQIRDDESNSIEDRKKANDELAIILNKQEKALLQQADAGVAVAQANLQVNNTVENRTALTQALGVQDQILADIQGKKSEQKVNEVALNKELIELDKARLKSSSELSIKQQKFDASLIDDKVERLKAEKDILEQEKVIELERLQNNINLYKEGTQARVDAEIEYLTKKQEIDNLIKKNVKDTADEEVRIEKKKQDELIKIREAGRQLAINQASELGNALINIASSISEFGRKSEKQKVKDQRNVALAGIALSTGLGIAQAVSDGMKVGVTPIEKGIAIASGIALVLANIAKARKTIKDADKAISQLGANPGPTPDLSVSAGGGGGGGAGQLTPPTFNLGGQQIGGAGTLLGSGFGQNQQQAIKVFVSETDISNVQNKVNVIEGNSLFEGPE